MSSKISVLTLSILAAVVITAERFVTATGNVATAAGNAIGAATTSAAVGERFPADVIGTTVVTAGGAIAAGAAIEVGAGGKAVTRTAGVTVARALQAAAADGDRIQVILINN